MTVRFRIKDADGALVYDLIQNPPQTGVYADYSSIAINPLESGAWEHSIRMFAGAAVDKDDIQSSLVTLDGVTYQINRYGARPGSTDQLWLHEKSEAESTERRAILIGATFQPTWEGSVGPLMVNDSGWVGLLRLTRLDWENTIYTEEERELTLNPSSVDSVVQMFPMSFAGSLESRIRIASINITNSTIYKYTVGFRREESATSNYQPIGNMGAGVLDEDGNTPSNWPGGPGEDYEMIPYSPGLGFTYPTGQATPAYMGYIHYVGGGVYTHYLRLNEISLQDTDTYNDDYVGEYEVFLRHRIPNGIDGTDAYYSFQVGFGDTTSSLKYNDPVYIKRSSDTDWAHISLGSMNLPTSSYTKSISELGASFFLKGFTIAIRTKIVGATITDDIVEVDSVFLMPKQNFTVTNVSNSGAVETDFAYIVYGHSPIGDPGLIITSPYQELELTGNPYVEPGDANVIVLKRIVPAVAANTGTFTLQTINKYLTSKP